MVDGPVECRLAAILAAGVVRYSRLMGEDAMADGTGDRSDYWGAGARERAAGRREAHGV